MPRAATSTLETPSKMPKKSFALDDGLAVTIYKRRASRNLRLTLTSNGEVRVSLPSWVPYKTGLDFARARQDWIKSQVRHKQFLQPGQAIGKAHRLEFIPKADLIKASSRISGNSVKVYMPFWTESSQTDIQKVAEAASIRALRQQAESLLPQRLASLADKYNFQYKSVAIKRLKGRWGSCDQATNITLNLFLMQLPWDLIDYVLLHELTHTEILRHGPTFWQAMAEKLPNVAQQRKLIKTYAPIIRAAV
jgi:predicted metal-dependent hydrolase